MVRFRVVVTLAVCCLITGFNGSGRYSRLVAGISCVVVGITVWQVCSVDDRYTEMLVATYPIDRIA